MWSKQQVATFQRALAAAQKWQAALEHLQEIAKVSPEFEDRINELMIRATNVEALATIALQHAEQTK
jgi:hypothetical protein